MNPRLIAPEKGVRTPGPEQNKPDAGGKIRSRMVREETVTKQEFDEGHDGLHVPLTCEDHQDLRWSCKRVALSLDGGGKYRYNGWRNLFYAGHDDRECGCPSSKLYAIFEESGSADANPK